MNLSVEILRIVSAFMIVWYHTGISFAHQVTYSGLIVFIILTIFFNLRFNNLLAQFSTVAKRVMMPWAFWFVVYGLGNIVIGNPFLETDGNLVESILSGSKIHLWYLPFIFCAVISILLISTLMSLDVLGFVFGLLYIASVISIGLWRDWSIAMGPPFAQYFHALPAVFLGAFFATYYKTPRSQFNVMLLGLVIVTFSALSIKGFGLPYLIAMALVYLAITKPVKTSYENAVLSVSQHTYGIYLTHPIFLFLLLKVGYDFNYLLPLVVFIISLCFVYLIREYMPWIARKVT